MNDNIIAYIIAYIAGMEVIKVFNQTTTSFRKYLTSVENYKQYTLDWYRSCWNYMTIYSIILPSTMLFLVPGGTLFYLNGTLPLGTFMLSMLLAMSMGVPLMRLVEFLPSFPMLKQKAGKIEEVFAEIELEDGQSKPPSNYTVSFAEVNFACCRPSAVPTRS